MHKIGESGLCEYRNCINMARGRCEGSYTYLHEGGIRFVNDCNKYFCDEHLKWGRGTCCIAAKFCPKHHRGYYCCTIL